MHDVYKPTEKHVSHELSSDHDLNGLRTCFLILFGHVAVIEYLLLLPAGATTQIERLYYQFPKRSLWLSRHSKRKIESLHYR